VSDSSNEHPRVVNMWTTNRVTGSNVGYDAVGNMTSMPFGGGARTFTSITIIG
jgi:hypothetical protein